VVVADCVSGENPKLEGRLYAARIRYVLAVRPHRGTWQFVADEAHPPAFTPAEAAARLPKDRWHRTSRRDSHGHELVRFVAELELGPAFGLTNGVRLIAAIDDPIGDSPVNRRPSGSKSDRAATFITLYDWPQPWRLSR
jgi:hypothetical protein